MWEEGCFSLFFGFRGLGDFGVGVMQDFPEFQVSGMCRAEEGVGEVLGFWKGGFHYFSFLGCTFWLCHENFRISHGFPGRGRIWILGEGCMLGGLGGEIDIFGFFLFGS